MIAQFLSIMCQGLSNINALSAAADSADHATSCYAHIRISQPGAYSTVSQKLCQSGQTLPPRAGPVVMLILPG